MPALRQREEEGDTAVNTNLGVSSSPPDSSSTAATWFFARNELAEDGFTDNAAFVLNERVALHPRSTDPDRFGVDRPGSRRCRCPPRLRPGRWAPP